MKLYLDTSVFGGFYDVEFEKWTRPLFDEIVRGKHLLVISPAVLRELEGAPQRVKDIIPAIPREHRLLIADSLEIDRLREAYIRSGVLTLSEYQDAEHIASASVAAVDVLISWNFKHMVNLIKAQQVNNVNLQLGFPPMNIVTPMEIISDDQIP